MWHTTIKEKVDVSHKYDSVTQGVYVVCVTVYDNHIWQGLVFINT
jgi:hypothetical protein